MDYLYEIEYLPEEQKVPVTDIPIYLEPLIYTFSRKVKQLVSPQRSPNIKKFVQASKFDQYLVPATDQEYLVPLSLPTAEGFHFLHF